MQPLVEKQSKNKTKHPDVNSDIDLTLLFKTAQQREFILPCLVLNISKLH